MTPTVLFRRDGFNAAELEAAARHLPVVESRCACNDALVVGRYSVLPYYRELEEDLASHGSRLVNTHAQHRWVADFEYYGALRPYTFESWDEAGYLRCGYDGPVVVKGRTNSRKHDWDTKMFAPDRSAALRVAAVLRSDPVIGDQGLVFRRYTPLVTYEVGLNGLPFTNEWRCFFLGEDLLAYGYYWTEAEDVSTPVLSAAGLAFAREVAAVVARYVNFFVLDVGEKAEGGWVLVEVNDGQMSGLSMVDPDELYLRLFAGLHAL